MKIRGIMLRNVRRFQGQTARITGIADGVSTITAANESGKSTFFDALHVLFFFSHKSTAAEVKSLKPYAGGAVEIAAEVEDDLGRAFRIEKKYLTGKSARVTDLGSGRIVAQEGEAEAWIAALIGADGTGPAGLLWVRQGQAGFGPDGTGAKDKAERERLREARQDLMSSVAGQIDSVTGGRRMDMIMQAVQRDLEALATTTGRPKAGGAWDKAERAGVRLAEQRDLLAAQVAELSGALQDRAALEQEQARAADPDAEARRKTDIDAARAAVTAARTHAARIDDAARDLRLLELETQQVCGQLAAEDAAAARRIELQKTAQAAGAASQMSTQASARALEDYSAQKDLHARADAALRVARGAVARAHAEAARVRQLQRRADIESLLRKIAALEVERRDHSARARDIAVTPKALEALDALAQALSQARARRDAGAATLTLRYRGAARATLDGADLAGDTPLSVVRAIDLDLPGLGTMHLRPAASADADADSDAGAPERLEPALADALAAVSVADLAQARAALRTKQAALDAASLCDSKIDTLAPDGSDPLRRELSLLPESDAQAQDGPAGDIEALIAAAEQSETAETAARQTRDAAQETYNRAARLAAEHATAARIAQDQKAAAQGTPLPAKDRADLAAAVAAARQAEATAADVLRRLRDAAPDAEAANAELQRLTSAKANADAARQRRQTQISTLTGLIGARAEDGVEARLEEVRGALDEAQARAARYAFEVAVLTTLRTELDTSRRAARDAYFEPVKAELLPLLSMLHEGAAFEMDPDTMLPAQITRDGQAEDIDVLSGGAAEQIAVLTRLAFARLYARSGRSVPVILDDALVFSDDARIVRMFTALTRSARDQQIIVFSCRTRAFEDLGGTRPQIEVIADAGLS